MNDKTAVPERMCKEVELTEDTEYFTIKGKQDFWDKNGYPAQNEANYLTYAKRTGTKLLLRIDDRGEFINPVGLYAQKNKLDRFIVVPPKAFESYLNFLKTKNNVHFIQATRNVV